MKKLSTFLMTILVLVMHVACAQKNTADVKFNDPKMNDVWADYSKLKDALVASKPEAAKQFAVGLKKSAGFARVSAVESAAASLAAAPSLDEQRKIFSTLTEAMTNAISKGSLSSGILYKDYCPMANDNAGGYWFSSEKAITNPYFGDSMLRCGSVKEIIQ